MCSKKRAFAESLVQENPVSANRRNINMKVDLITGFLGVGKTTFIRRYLEYLEKHGQKAAVIENEFGSVDIDSQLLQDTGCAISSLAGECMCCTGKDTFRHMLIDAAEEGVDRVLVEPSGIYDVDEFFDVMLREPVKSHCEIGSILTLVDTCMDAAITDESRYLVFAQLLAAGTVIMSKTQLFDESRVQITIGQMNALIREHGGSRVLGSDVVVKDWDSFTDKDFEMFMASGYHLVDHEKEFIDHGDVFQSCMLASRCVDEKDLRERIGDLMTNSRYGIVMRLKGHIRSLENVWYEVNCSPDVCSLRPCNVRRGVFVVIGQQLNEKAIAEEAFIPRKTVQ